MILPSSSTALEYMQDLGSQQALESIGGSCTTSCWTLRGPAYLSAPRYSGLGRESLRRKAAETASNPTSLSYSDSRAKRRVC